MLKFITNFFGFKKAEPTPAPYKVETPSSDAPVVNSVKPVVNGRKAPTAKAKEAVATGNQKTQPKKKVSSGANKSSKTKK